MTTIPMRSTAADRDAMMLDLCTAIRKVPPATWRDLAKRRLPGDDLAEKIAARTIFDHLVLRGWEFGHRPPAEGHGAP
jgi:hypothetical protein